MPFQLFRAQMFCNGVVHLGFNFQEKLARSERESQYCRHRRFLESQQKHPNCMFIPKISKQQTKTPRFVHDLPSPSIQSDWFLAILSILPTPNKNEAKQKRVARRQTKETNSGLCGDDKTNKSFDDCTAVVVSE
eukprot:c20396_g2_i4.p1 GENE.c20396_g2_i4~~c20396_g2_i4.p1  ORF type:complete len:134 (-),score=22.45 c20396_g2_i4:223-624(-)